MTILRTHHHDGTAGTAATAAGEGYDALVGTAPTYVAGGFTNQALQWTSTGSAAYLQDNSTGGYYAAAYVRFPALPSSDLAFLLRATAAGSAVGVVQVGADGLLHLWSSFTTAVAAGTVALAAGQWYRLEWHCAAAGQELRIFNPATSGTPSETLTGAGGGDPERFRVGTPWTGKSGTAGDLVQLDEVSVADAWPSLGTGTTGPTVRGVIQSGAEVAAAVRGVISGGAEVAAGIRQVISGGGQAADTFPLTLPATLA